MLTFFYKLNMERKMDLSEEEKESILKSRKDKEHASIIKELEVYFPDPNKKYCKAHYWGVGGDPFRGAAKGFAEALSHIARRIQEGEIVVKETKA